MDVLDFNEIRCRLQTTMMNEGILYSVQCNYNIDDVDKSSSNAIG